MSTSNTYNTSEQQAAQLWNSFQRKNQEDFWIAYEAVLQKLRPNFQNTPPQKKLKSVKFHPPKAKVMLYSIVSVFVLFTLALPIFENSSLTDGNFAHGLTMLLFTVFLTSLLFWKLNSFKLDHQGLTIYKLGNIQYRTFSWPEIQRAYKRVYKGEETYTKLVVVTKSKKFYYFDALATQPQSRFYKTLQVYAQNSTIKKY